MPRRTADFSTAVKKQCSPDRAIEGIDQTKMTLVVGLVRQDPAVLVDGSDRILWTKMLFYLDSRTNSVSTGCSSNSLLHVRIIAGILSRNTLAESTRQKEEHQIIPRER